jgi:hypothetical protein
MSEERPILGSTTSLVTVPAFGLRAKSLDLPSALRYDFAPITTRPGVPEQTPHHARNDERLPRCHWWRNESRVERG